MIKYTSNEQYEKDRLKIIARHSILKDMGIDIIDLLKQSKWIGAFDVTAYEDGYQAGYIDGESDKDEEDG